MTRILGLRLQMAKKIMRLFFWTTLGMFSIPNFCVFFGLVQSTSCFDGVDEYSDT